MKILALLEGLIKVPKSTTDDIMAIISRDIFSRIFTYIDSDEGEDYFDRLPSFKNMMSQYSKKYGRFDLTSISLSGKTSGKVYMRMDDIPDRYKTRNPNLSGKIIPIDVFVGLSNDDGPSGEYSPKSGRTPARISIWPCNQKTILGIVRSPELLHSLMHEIAGAVEHEVMHAIQDMVFKQITPDSSSGEGDAYFLDPIEFLPQIRTAAASFISGVQEARARGNLLNSEILKQHFIRKTNPSMGGSAFPFFDALYRNDRTKWKKAVKLLHSLVSGSL